MDYYERIRLIALTLFEWTLPEGCNARYLEDTLYKYGYGLLYRDKNLGFMNARCTQNGRLNYYDEAIAYSAYGNGYSRTTIPAKECVLVRNNAIQRPTDETVMLFASRLTENQRTVDINLNALKTPCFTTCDEQDKLTIENIYKKWDGFSPIIIGGKKLNREVIQVLKTDAPYYVDKLDIHDTKIWNDVYTFFGINNANTAKRERMIVDEANANNEVISINADAMLACRQKACEEFNTMYPGVNASVKMRDLSGGSKPKEGETNGELHD
jgi:hypothetical protein